MQFEIPACSKRAQNWRQCQQLWEVRGQTFPHQAERPTGRILRLDLGNDSRVDIENDVNIAAELADGLLLFIGRADDRISAPAHSSHTREIIS